MPGVAARAAAPRSRPRSSSSTTRRRDGSAEPVARALAATCSSIALDRNVGFGAANNVGDSRDGRAARPAAEQRHDRAARRDRPARRAAHRRPARPPPGRASSTPTAGPRSRSARCCRRWPSCAQRAAGAAGRRRGTPRRAAYVARLRRRRARRWTGSAARACSSRRDAALAAGLLRRALLHVRGGRGLLRRACARGAAASSSRPAAEVVHLRGRSIRAGAQRTARRTTTAATCVLREAPAPAGRRGCARWLRAARPRAFDRISAEPSLVRIAIDARKLHDYGIGTYVRNLVARARAAGRRRRVRPALPAARTPSSSESLGPRFERARRARRQLLGPRADQRAAGARARACRPLPRAALRRVAADALPVRRDDSRLHSPAVSAVPAEPAAHVYARTMMRMAARRARGC